MRKFINSLLFSGCAVLAVPALAIAHDVVDLKWTSVTREYCHILRFSSGWQMPKFIPSSTGIAGSLEVVPKFDLSGDYEFRVPGSLETRFLVRGVENFGKKFYAPRIYVSDFSDRRGIAHPVSEKEWDSATVVTVPHDTHDDGVRLLGQLSKNAGFQGLESMMSGDKLDKYYVVRISPDRSLFVLSSWSGTLGPSAGSDVPGDFSVNLKFGRAHGKLFFDVYNADTRAKLLTVSANFVDIFPEAAFEKSGWITERYFFIPLDERRERCLICDFGRKQ